jgi:hypothetical protein
VCVCVCVGFGVEGWNKRTLGSVAYGMQGSEGVGCERCHRWVLPSRAASTGKGDLRPSQSISVQLTGW